MDETMRFRATSTEIVQAETELLGTVTLRVLPTVNKCSGSHRPDRQGIQP